MHWLFRACVAAIVFTMGCHEGPPAGQPQLAGIAVLDGAVASEHAGAGFNTETYDHQIDNRFQSARQHPLSTFSIDVDTASYANVRRFLNNGQLPPAGAVRIEELINYFPYTYPQPTDNEPFSVTFEVADCPWKPGHRLARIGLKGREFEEGARPVSNLVFLIDVSGSMQAPNKLPLVQQGLELLVDRLNENDRVAIVVYAGAAGLVLNSTTANRKATILTAIDRLQTGGSTHGAAGIELAYQVAGDHFVTGGTNRVILCTDGDFNVGATSQDQLVRLIQARAQSGVFLSVLGFGMGNLKDATLEKLADNGNGNYAYIDSLHEARKVFVDQGNGTLITIAKDVKIQVEFNPRQVAAYRLIGYENRLLAAEDFHDDRKDAGEIGAGHTVTALYELVPTGAESDVDVGQVDSLKYQPNPAETDPTGDDSVSTELFTLKLRFKHPDSDTSVLRESVCHAGDEPQLPTSPDFSFAAAVASLGMLLRDSPHRGNSSFGLVLELAERSRGADPGGYRSEFLKLVHRARQLAPQQTARR